MNDAIIQLTNGMINYVLEMRLQDQILITIDRPLRDVGSWMHLLVAIDTTHIQPNIEENDVNGDSLLMAVLIQKVCLEIGKLDLQFNDLVLNIDFLVK